MANRNGTPGFYGSDAPVKPNAGINLPAITGTKVGKKSKKRSVGKSSKRFSNAAGTRSGVMRNP